MEEGSSKNAGDDAEFDPPIRRPSGIRRTSSSLAPPPESCLHCPQEGAQEETDDYDTEPSEHALKAELEKDTKGSGKVWHAKVMTDDYFVKPRRPMPLINVSELYDKLENINGEYILRGPLNDWPGLKDCKLRSLTCAKKGVIHKSVERLWTASSDGPSPALPEKSTIPKATRATFVTAEWTSNGWSGTSPGFVFWFTREKQCIFGEEMLKTLGADKYASAYATVARTFAHRYPAEKETWKDKQTWHAGVLVEWSHKEFATLIELAWVNGVGGYGGKSNWIEDKLEPSPALERAMPDAMKIPWDSNKSEIRMYDMPFKDKDGMLAHLNKYSENGGLPLQQQRFKEPCVDASSEVRIRGCTPTQLAGFMLNYIHRVGAYVEWDTNRAQNCQTFAADLYAFLAGKPGVVPFGQVMRPMYKQRGHAFLYRP